MNTVYIRRQLTYALECLDAGRLAAAEDASRRALDGFDLPDGPCVIAVVGGDGSRTTLPAADAADITDADLDAIFGDC